MIYFKNESTCDKLNRLSMQTYADYHLLRFYLGRVLPVVSLFFLWSFLAFANEQIEITERDSLYVSWSKSKSTLPLFKYSIQDVESLDEFVFAKKLIDQYGVGLIGIKNPDVFNMKVLISELQKTASVKPFFVLELAHPFEFTYKNWNSELLRQQLEVSNNDSKIEELAEHHAALLSTVGFSVLHIESIPDNYKQAENKKVYRYLQHLESNGVMISFGAGANPFLIEHPEIINWSNTKIINQQLAKELSPGLVKKAKKFRNETGFDGLISVSDISAAQLSSKKSNSFKQGMDMVALPADRMEALNLLNAVQNTGIQKKGYFKKLVHHFYRTLNKNTDHQFFSEQKLMALKRKFDRASFVLTKNDGGQIPVQDLSDVEIFTISVSDQSFQQFIDYYKSSQHFSFADMNVNADSLRKEFEKFDLGVVALSDLTERKQLIYQIGRLKRILNLDKLIAVYGGSKENFDILEQFGSVIWCPKGISNANALFPQMVFGAMDIAGQLPGHWFEDGAPRGTQLASIGRLQYDVTNHNVNNQKLLKIEKMVEQAIHDQYFPGCQVLMAKNGEVVYQKSFGYNTYDSLNAVSWDQLYDIASVTKTTATVPAMIHLVDQQKVSTESTLDELLPYFSATDKADLQVRDLLMHQSGLRSYIPFWRKAELDSTDFLYKKRKRRRSRKYSLISIDWNDSINAWIAKSSFNSLKNEDGTFRYLYSDLGFMVLDDLVEYQTNQSLDELLGQMIYNPMGMDFTTFQPSKSFSIDRIAPTEKDNHLRKSLVQGTVHDRNAALLHGVSGHAGLFSNANDLAKYMQMMLQHGYYGGKQYFSAKTVDFFTEKPEDSYRRALGWDKPNSRKTNISKYASDKAFGHSGFTGTLVWADPEHDLVYVFLSNRIYPDAQNNKLIESNFRTKIHDLMYESFLPEETIESFGM